MRTELVSDALTMAIGRRLPPQGLTHHSDRGSQYASAVFQQQLDANASFAISGRGNAGATQPPKASSQTIKNELIYRRPWPTQQAARNAIVEFISEPAGKLANVDVSLTFLKVDHISANANFSGE